MANGNFLEEVERGGKCKPVGTVDKPKTQFRVFLPNIHNASDSILTTFMENVKIKCEYSRSAVNAARGTVHKCTQNEPENRKEASILYSIARFCFIHLQ
jgi:hypothetical protein